MTANDVLRNSPLFLHIAATQLQQLLDCLKAVRRQYGRDEYVFLAGDRAATLGVVLSGGVHILMDDLEGKRSILAHAGPGELFGEAFSCARVEALPVSMLASEPSEVLLVDYRKIVTTCPESCAFHTRMIMNMLQLLAHSNILLTRKLAHIAKRTTREKLLSFLTMQTSLAKSAVVDIPFNRQELADYLCVDRSALSRELGAMRAEGILRCDGNRFELLGA